MSLPEIVSGDCPLPTSTPTPPLPVITLPIIPEALTPKLARFNPTPRLPLIVLPTTPTVTPCNINPPLPLLCTTLFHTSDDPQQSYAFNPQPLLRDSVHPYNCRLAR
jgi:hypothetical protein